MNGKATVTTEMELTKESPLLFWIRGKVYTGKILNVFVVFFVVVRVYTHTQHENKKRKSVLYLCMYIYLYFIYTL